MSKIVPIGLMIVLTITGCTGPGGLFGNDDEIEERFVYDLTIEDLWNDIPEKESANILADEVRITESELRHFIISLTKIKGET